LPMAGALAYQSMPVSSWPECGGRIPDTKPSCATRCAFEISTPCGFIASALVAEKVDASRIREDVKDAGFVAARRAVRANIVATESKRRFASASDTAIQW